MANARVGIKGISDDYFRKIILSGINPGAFSSWVWFYHYGKDGIQQMTQQIDAFKVATYPVSMLQGDSDKGQPNYLFDGTAKMV